jgi:hypothetical protein
LAGIFIFISQVAQYIPMFPHSMFAGLFIYVTGVFIFHNVLYILAHIDRLLFILPSMVVSALIWIWMLLFDIKDVQFVRLLACNVV